MPQNSAQTINFCLLFAHRTFSCVQRHLQRLAWCLEPKRRSVSTTFEIHLGSQRFLWVLPRFWNSHPETVPAHVGNLFHRTEEVRALAFQGSRPTVVPRTRTWDIPWSKHESSSLFSSRLRDGVRPSTIPPHLVIVLALTCQVVALSLSIAGQPRPVEGSRIPSRSTFFLPLHLILQLCVAVA